MRLGYPVINLGIEFDPDAVNMIGFAKEKVFGIVAQNLAALRQVLEFNASHGVLFFRVRPDLVPYATHPRCQYDWAGHFKDQLVAIAELIRRFEMRITIHPLLATSLILGSARGVQETLAELAYQHAVLSALGLGADAKIQVHLGPLDKRPVERCIALFAERYRELDPGIREHLVIENDNVWCTLERCLRIHDQTGIPIVFDALHHRHFNSGESLPAALTSVSRTWRPADGPMIVEYSSQRPQKMLGKHAESLDLADFREFLTQSQGFDFDLMLELKDRERSALVALELLKDDPRFIARHLS